MGAPQTAEAAALYDSTFEDGSYIVRPLARLPSPLSPPPPLSSFSLPLFHIARLPPLAPLPSRPLSSLPLPTPKDLSTRKRLGVRTDPAGRPAAAPPRLPLTPLPAYLQVDWQAASD